MDNIYEAVGESVHPVIGYITHETLDSLVSRLRWIFETHRQEARRRWCEVTGEPLV